MTTATDLPFIGLQLYSVRDELSRDFAGTLRRVADIGYTGVETAFFDEGVSLDEASRQLRALGLTVFSAHVDLPLGVHRDDTLRAAEISGCKRIAWHGWPQDPRYSSLDGIRHLADDYNAANEVAAANGLQLGLHNHWWEMTPVEGQLPYRVLRERLDPRIFFELDVYWAKVAGLEPVAVIQELDESAPLLHIKDGPAVRNQPMTAVGSGSLNIPAIVAAAHGTAEWLVVELDECATDMMQAVEQSYRYLTANGLGR